MARLDNRIEFVTVPRAPFSFHLTVRNPAGWALFTPFEIFEDGTLWTATHLKGHLCGIRLESAGSVDEPAIRIAVFTEGDESVLGREEIEGLLRRKLGADQDLAGFYSMAAEDGILRHTLDDLYGLHDTFPLDIFPEATLAILLQMAPLKRSNEMMASFITTYGDLAEFDGRRVRAWPTPQRISGIGADELSSRCKVGYRAKSIVKLAVKLASESFPSTEELAAMEPKEARKRLLQLPGIGDYSADIISPHGGFPIDVWSAEVFSMLFFGTRPENNRQAVETVKKEGIERWGKWSWMAFFYVVQDLPGLSRKLGLDLRLT